MVEHLVPDELWELFQRGVPEGFVKRLVLFGTGPPMALRWLESASMPITDSDEPRLARAALDVLALQFDGQSAASSTFRQERNVANQRIEDALA